MSRAGGTPPWRGGRQIYLHRQGDRYVLEALTGGKDGTSKSFGPMTEQEALKLAERWRQGQEGWRETGGPAASGSVGTT